MQATRDFVRRSVTAWQLGSAVDFSMAVIHKSDCKIIGACSYNDRSDFAQGVYEIGYWCDVDYQGQGYVTEYANALSIYALEVLKAEKVVIAMHVDNHKSRAVAERLSFSPDGMKVYHSTDNASQKPGAHAIYTLKHTARLPALEYSWSPLDNVPQ